MKSVHVLSDLHLEFDYFRPHQDADILVLAGDICVAHYLAKDKGAVFLDFFKFCSEKYETVLYVLGNHEHYGSRFTKTEEIIRKALSDFENIIILDDEFYEDGDTLFVGSTLWTDCNNSNPISMSTLKYGMNDYRIIKHFDGINYRKLDPADTAKAHNKSLSKIKDFVAGHDNVFVITHHSPSFNSVATRFVEDTHMNAGYYSSLDLFILDHPQIKHWVHGHMHNNSDYMIGDCRVLCNPKGYNKENPLFDDSLIINLAPN